MSLINKLYRLLILLYSPFYFLSKYPGIRQERRIISLHCANFSESILFVEIYIQFLPHLFPVIRELLAKRPESAIIILTPKEHYPLIVSHPFFQEFPQVLCVTTLPAAIPNLKIALALSPDTKLKTPPNFHLQPSVVRCVLQHGLADKKQFSEWFEPKPLHDYDVIFIAGPVFLEGSFKSYCEKYPGLLKTRNVLHAGLCRTDSLIRWAENHPPQNPCANNEVPTIIYAPTWQASASLGTMGDKILEQLIRFKGKVIFRPHPAFLMCGSRRRSGKEWIRLFADLEARYPHVKFSKEALPDSDFFASDLMISDVSGAAFEFLLMDKPVVFIDAPGFFNDWGTEGIQYWGRFAGDIVSDLDQLMDTIELNLQEPSRKAAERALLRQQLLYNPGHAAERSADYIIDILDNPDNYLKRNQPKES